MEIKIAITVGGNEPIEVKIDVPETETNKNIRKESDVSVYATWFDERCYVWSKSPVNNKYYLLCQQHYFNDKLRERGYLFLNEVYDALGMARTAAGQVVGWYYDPVNPIGDNYVDFGLSEERNIDFINGNTNRVLLDFNVDGDILKYL